MSKTPEYFCPVFRRIQQLAEEKGLNPENTALNRQFCPFAQACLAVARKTYQEMLHRCKLFEKPPAITTICLRQQGSHPVKPQEAFMRRLETTAVIRGIPID
ncbi:MAG: hypothetical protein QHH09_00095 [Microgenomates group bacterium]|jgi:hypothetical protein|nr:hypothetical protein [Microgenomates group bacterium]